mmetsp:Transcript_10845/g.28438  ORF Transcript_10845/g.28438 Transcript_10845/m.28438 type:complete len:238 (+) Transcript_10845:597-1310(+)
MPLVHLCAVACLALLPLSLPAQQRMLVFAEICEAWSALDVFVASLLGALTQIERFSLFVVGHRCNVIDGLVSTYLAALVKGEPRCFDVKASLRPDCWALFAAVALSALATRLVTGHCERALAIKTEAEQEDESAAELLSARGSGFHPPYQVPAAQPGDIPLGQAGTALLANQGAAGSSPQPPFRICQESQATTAATTAAKAAASVAEAAAAEAAAAAAVEAAVGTEVGTEVVRRARL